MDEIVECVQGMRKLHEGFYSLVDSFCATKLELYCDVNRRPISLEYKAELS